MKLLAFDAATPVLSVALWEEKLVYSCFLNRGLTHSETLLPMIEQALKICGWALSDLDRLAVTIGPGSFTGLRIGASTAQGLAFGQDIPCVGVSTLEAMAQDALLSGAARAGERLVPVLDARRGQVYTATFLVSVTPDPPTKATSTCITGMNPSTSFSLTRLCEDRVCLFEDLLHETPTPFLLVEGSSRFYADCVHVRGEMAATGAACIGALSAKTIPYHQLQPKYLRKP